MIKCTKINTSLEKVCQDTPQEFIDYITTCREMDFYQEPPYDDLRQLMHAALLQGKHENDRVFDWSDEKESDTSTSYSSGKHSSLRKSGKKRKSDRKRKRCEDLDTASKQSR